MPAGKPATTAGKPGASAERPGGMSPTPAAEKPPAPEIRQRYDYLPAAAAAWKRALDHHDTADELKEAAGLCRWGRQGSPATNRRRFSEGRRRGGAVPADAGRILGCPGLGSARSVQPGTGLHGSWPKRPSLRRTWRLNTGFAISSMKRTGTDGWRKTSSTSARPTP